MATHSAGPGWYATEESLRYWDGDRWTDLRRPLPRETRTPLPRDSRPWTVRVAFVVVLALLTASAWWGWLGWHDLEDGDYQVWQGIGCVLHLLALGIIAPRFTRPITAIVTMTSAFTVAVGADWIPTDETGLAGVGVVML
ncbi:MAG: hypothetical protein ACRDQA_22330, partial [Nocardioidaceae bacterium]